jgi:hypothetical protein
VNLQVKYFLARLGILLLCAVPAFLLLPAGMDGLLKILIAFVASAAISYFVLRDWAEQAGESLLARRQRKKEERQRLRATLEGEDENNAGGADRR